MLFCSNCGKEVTAEANFCWSCGKGLKALGPSKDTSYSNNEHVNPRIALLLALVPGIFSLMGFGHIYAGKVARGIAIFGMGILLSAIIPGNPLFIPSLFWSNILLLPVMLALMAWQAYNAYSLARKLTSKGS